jgi:hypothetical protein
MKAHVLGGVAARLSGLPLRVASAGFFAAPSVFADLRVGRDAFSRAGIFLIA